MHTHAPVLHQLVVMIRSSIVVGDMLLNICLWNHVVGIMPLESCHWKHVVFVADMHCPGEAENM